MTCLLHPIKSFVRFVWEERKEKGWKGTIILEERVDWHPCSPRHSALSLISSQEVRSFLSLTPKSD